MSAKFISPASPVGSFATRAKEQVALYSLLATLALLLLKLLATLGSHSVSMEAETANSGLDLIAALLTWWAIRIAAQPADANHPFGHGKFENFAAFLETGLLVATSVAVVWQAAERIGSPRPIALGWEVFAVMIFSVVVDFWRARALRRVAFRFPSDVLEADALNYSGDLWGSVAVLIGLGIALLGQKLHLPTLLGADAAGAMAVAGIMIYLAVRLGRRTVGALLDEAPVALRDELRDRVGAVPGVVAVDRLRLRRSGSRYFMDLRLALARTLSLERARRVRDEVTARIQNRLPDADVVVETQPGRPAAVNVFEQVRAIALGHDVQVHELSIYDVPDGLDIELHLELDENLDLKQAHDWVSEIEREIRLELPQTRQIVSHIEPEHHAAVPAANVDAQRIARRAREIAATEPDMQDCHDVEVRRSSGHLLLTCHCSFADSLPVGRVHEIVSRFEALLQREMPELARITIHTEPVSDNRR